ncbi:MAG: epoxyqueuosine reductase QueH [Candidatus Omnitrophica bacterium]|nr:epoxyqueuosine reductase QueH [Candidatus Omnitrophota bacterium]
MNRKILLHICCGVCASAAAQRLQREGFEVTGFFYNPNIHPPEEYRRRLEAAQAVAAKLHFTIAQGPYDTQSWFAAVKGMEQEKEGGRRCQACFQIRLEASYRKALEAGFAYFTTTLTISPHKESGLISRIGKSLDKDMFLDYDFKTEDGFKKAMQFSREQQIYRQHFCGCIFSARQVK